MMSFNRSTSLKLLFSAGIVSATFALAFSRGRAEALHLHLLRSQPRADSTVTTAPAAIQLWFSEVVKPSVTAVRLVGSDSASVALEPLTAGTTTTQPVVAKIKAPLKAGKYRVLWKTMGSDGHALNGEFSFTYRTAEAESIHR